MDADRFDTLAKRLVTPTTRRATLGAVAAGGLLSALGLSRTVPAAQAAQDGTCALAFVAMVRQGPSVEQALTPNGTRPGELRGELRFSLSETGNLEDGTLLLPDGASLPVVGQATGHSLQVRIELGQRLALVAVGVGEQAVAACQGAIDGVATGPEVGDLGDWHAAVLRQTARTGSGGTGVARQGATGPAGASSPGRTGRTGRTGATAAPSNAGPTAPVGPTPTPAAASTTGSTGRSTESGACASGLTRCDGVCVDLQTDRSNCGACQKPCASGVCAGGVCGPGGGACPAGQTDCGGVCVDLQSDPNNCGACGTACGILHCITGFCCPAGSDVCGGVCVDLFADPANCGACGNVCAAGLVCRQRGMCVCPVGLDSCNGVCADLQTDAANCGACGTPCAANQFCEGGICIGGDQLCAAGLSLCGFGFCVDLQTDPTNCGACGYTCGGDPCISGVCTGVVGPPPPDLLLTCADAGLTDCGDICVDLSSDAANCGACGYNCPLGGFCQGGACTAE